MIKIRRSYEVAILMAALFLVGFGLGKLFYRPEFRLGDRTIQLNPRAKINLKKEYHLIVWDYDLPLRQQSYRDYLRRAIGRFEQTNPNIKVQLKLLDLLDGQEQLTKGLRSGDLPDVYCSVYQVPSFDYRWQIPVGPFFRDREELRVYDPLLVKLLSVAGVQCSFPRWTAPVVWIGNRFALEKAGLSVQRIWQTGWTWEELLTAYEKNRGKYRFAAIGGDSGFLGQLLMTQPAAGTAPVQAGLDLLERLVRAKAVPADYATNAIGRFLNGNALVLAGARPGLYRFLKQREQPVVAASAAGERPAVDPVLLPVPGRRGDPAWLPAENGAIMIYRNRRTRGDDQITAAVRLGYFLSTYPDSRPWQELLVYPGAIGPRQDWERAIGAEYPLGYLLKRASLINQNRPTGESATVRLLNEYLIGQKNREEIIGALQRSAK